jgi:radical SAM superfamily enzyme YgiQ (UPF0313 family)
VKLLLFQPPIQDFYDTELRLLPLGLGYLKAAVRRHLPGLEVAVRDFHQGWGRRTVSVPPELGYLSEYYPFPDQSPFSTFHGYYHYGAPFETVAAEVAVEKPDVVGISSLFSAYHREVLRCAQAVKQRIGVPVVIGGSHASAAPHSLLGSSAVDYVVRGEGERPLVALLAALRDGGDLSRVPGLAWRRDGRVVLNPQQDNFPLEELDYPDLGDLDPGRYRLGKKNLATIVTSRGCPHRCAFCSVHATFGTHYRRRRTEDVVAELRLRWDQGYRAFDFEDDNLNSDPAAAKHLFRALLAEFGERTLTLHAMNGLSYRRLDRELLELLARAGFTHINLSLVSQDPETCRRVGRHHSLPAFETAVTEAVALGLRVVAYQILGLPGEPPSQDAATLAYLCRLPVLVGPSPFYLPPGSPMARVAPTPRKSELTRARLTALGGDPDPSARDGIYTLLVTSRILNFLKGLPAAGSTIGLSDALSRAASLGGRQALGAELLTRLLSEDVLHGADRTGHRPLPRFQAALFREVWNRAGALRTLDGGSVRLS